MSRDQAGQGKFRCRRPSQTFKCVCTRERDSEGPSGKSKCQPRHARPELQSRAWSLGGAHRPRPAGLALMPTGAGTQATSSDKRPGLRPSDDRRAAGFRRPAEQPRRKPPGGPRHGGDACQQLPLPRYTDLSGSLLLLVVRMSRKQKELQDSKFRNTAFLSPANPRPQRSQTRSHQFSLPAARVVIVSRSATRGRPGVLAPRTYTVRCARVSRLGRPERGQQQAPYPHPHCGDHSGGPRGLWALAKGSDSTCEETI